MKPVKCIVTALAVAVLAALTVSAMAAGSSERFRMAQANVGNRVALVIGNGTYPDDNKPLTQPVQDARALAEELRRSGFDVIVGEDLSKQKLRAALENFKSKIKPGSAALFFFSGYGIQTGKQSYIIPVDAQIWTEGEVKRDGVTVESILNDMNAAGAAIKVIIIDAARRNPFERRFRGFSAGLAALNVPAGTLAMYSAAPDRVANESDGENSLFVSELLKEMRSPGSNAETIFNNTRMGVSRASRNEQVPFVSSSLIEEFSFGKRLGPGPRQEEEQAKPSDAVDLGKEKQPKPPGPAKAGKEEQQPKPSDTAEAGKEQQPKPGTAEAGKEQQPKPSGTAEAGKEQQPEPSGTAEAREEQQPKPSGTAEAGEEQQPKPSGTAEAGNEEQTKPSGTAEAGKEEQTEESKVASTGKEGQQQSPERDEIIQGLDDQIRRNPQDADAFYRRGQAWAQRGEYALASDDFGEAIRINPRDAESLNNRCFTRAVMGQLEGALSDCNEAIRLRDDYADALDSRGLTHLKLGQYDRAIADFNAAIRINPKMASALFGRGKAKIKKGDRSGGNADIRSAKSIDPTVDHDYASYGIP